MIVRKILPEEYKRCQQLCALAFEYPLTDAALSPEERASLPPTIDVTCHMCGRTFSVAVLCD